MDNKTERKKYAYKACFRESENLESFSQKFGIGIGNTFFMTLTFKNNVTDKKKASEAWNNLLTQMRKQFSIFRFVLVWERQKRGCWHLHIVGSIPLCSMKQLKKYLYDFSQVSESGFGFSTCQWTTGRDYKGIAKYVTKYLTKENREAGIRYVSYSQNWIRRVKGAFAFAGGHARLWRLSCATLDKLFPNSFKYFYKNADFTYKLPVILLIQDSKKDLKSVVLYSPMQDFYQKLAKYGEFSVACNDFLTDCKYLINILRCQSIAGFNMPDYIKPFLPVVPYSFTDNKSSWSDSIYNSEVVNV